MTEKKQNKWRHGLTCFEIPPLDDYMGMRDGFLPLPMIIDRAVGEEVVLFVRDQTPFMEELRLVKPFRLMMRTGCVRNNFGPLVFFLFWVENPADLTEPFAAWDCYLNPKSDAQMSRWRSLAAQSHWHLFLVGTEGRQREFFEFENNYGLGEALDLIDESCRDIGLIDFNRAKDRFMSENTIDDLFRMQPAGSPPQGGVNVYETVYETRNPVVFGVPYEDIQTGDVATVLSALQGFLENRETVINGRGRVTLLFEGYDDDLRDVFDIPEIRRYAKALDEQFPYWFYFACLDCGSTLQVLSLCLCQVVKVPGGSTPHPDDLKQFLISHIVALNQLCEKFALGDAVKNQVTTEALAHLVPSSS